jgi:hypothetical protein
MLLRQIVFLLQNLKLFNNLSANNVLIKSAPFNSHEKGIKSGWKHDLISPLLTTILKQKKTATFGFY